MKKILIMAIFALFLATNAQADGQFSGFYAGINVGGSHATIHDSGFGPYPGCGGTCYSSLDYSTLTNPNHTNTSFTGGGQAGYNWQTGKYVLGVEADINASAHKAHHILPQDSGSADTKTESFATARARAGYAFLDNLMAYVTAGPAVSHGRGSILDGGGSYAPGALQDDRAFGFGWAAGIGAEYKVTNNIGVRGEYLHVQTTTRFVPVNTDEQESYGIHNVLDQDIGRVAVNWFFK